MSVGLIGRKIEMSQVFDDKGEFIPVTIIEAGPCVVVAKKTQEKEGYNSLQLGFKDVVATKINKPVSGHFKKADVKFKRYLREFRIADIDNYQVSQEFKADVFKEGDYLDVCGISKGKGFAGVVKRYHWKGGRDSHGSMFHRAPGSLGQSSEPSRVHKGHGLPGRMGGEKVTTQNLKVVKVDAEQNRLFVDGAVPGRKGGLLIIKKAVKKGN
ncbi:MAG: 50S ribosomal protein L3 [bacterium]|nr:50S ribosomal protein L3 [bacterium]